MSNQPLPIITIEEAVREAVEETVVDAPYIED